ncbi:MAG: GNAT family N-acetyltransferase [Steroidobacteraceae bacterium]
MLIRPATIEDVAGIASLVQRYWEYESMKGFDRPRVETLLGALLAETDRGACWVAETEGRLCGYLLAAFMFSLEHGGSMAEIDELFVSLEMRSLGVGALLLARAEDELAQRGLVRLQLQVGVANERARNFYSRHGFQRRAGYELLDKALASL